jgi:hypothetical protein
MDCRQASKQAVKPSKLQTSKASSEAVKVQTVCRLQVRIDYCISRIHIDLLWAINFLNV